MQAPGKLPEVADRRLERVPRRSGQRRRLPVALDLALQPPQGEERRRQPLLRSVVEVALQPPPLRVARRHQAQTRCAQLLDRVQEVPLQAVALHRDPHRGDERLEELGPLEETRLVREGTIDPADLKRLTVTDSVDEAVTAILDAATRRFGLSYHTPVKRRWFLGE